MASYGQMRFRKLRNRIILMMILLVVIPVVLYCFLFRVNHFSLEVRPLEPEDPVIPAGQEYQDPGAQAYLVGTLIGRAGFPVEAEISVTQDVNHEAPGRYSVAYHARWGSLEALGGHMVTVLDVTPPTITLLSDPNAVTILGQTYQEEGYTAWDDCDGDLTQYVTRVNDGEYVTYVVEDRAGNRTSVCRKIHYYDPIAPEIRLLGDVTMYVDAGVGFTEPGWSAIDNVDGDISHWVNVSGEVDIYRAGTYPLHYSVVDSTGNNLEVVRNVVVEPVQTPKTESPEGRVIYLTFDDGPGPYTRQLLKVLEKYGAKATFFVVDSEYQDVLSDIVAGGHSIGIHTVSHDYRSIYASKEAYFQDLLSMQQIIYDQTGVMTWLMRFPGGSSNTVSRFNKGIMSYLTKAVEDCGFHYFDWNVDSDDAGRTTETEKVFDNVIEGVQVYRVSIVLQHDIKDYSVAAVEKILRWGIENGYRFLGLDMTSPTAHHGVNN